MSVKLGIVGVGVMGADRRGAGHQGVGHGRQQSQATAAQVVFLGQSLSQSLVKAHQVVVEGVELCAAQFDAVVDFLGEDRELGAGCGNAAGGDLDVDGEDPEVGQGPAHLLDAVRKPLAGLGEGCDGVAAAVVLRGQRLQVRRGGLQLRGHGGDGLGVHRRAHLVERGDQPSQSLDRLGQHLARLEEPSFDSAAGGVQPWVLAEFRTVTGLVLGGDDLPTGPVARLSVGSLPLGLGVVDGELLTWTLSPIERVERSAPRPPQAVASPVVESSAVAEETIIRGRSHSSSLFGHGAPDAQGEEAPAQPVRPVAHELPGAVDIEPPVASDTPEQGRGRVAAEPFPATEPVILPPPPATFGLRTPQGDILPLDVPVLIGRRPAPPRVDAGVLPRLLTVPSPTQEVSGTHVRIEQSGDAVVVTDLRSTNGTRLLRPGAGPVALRPGESAVALRGTAVEIGDGNIIEITAVPSGSPSGAAPSSGGDDRRGEGLE